MEKCKYESSDCDIKYEKKKCVRKPFSGKNLHLHYNDTKKLLYSYTSGTSAYYAKLLVSF